MPAFTNPRRRRSLTADHWPGFVDALSSLLLVIIFLLSMFVLAQFFLGQTLSGRDEELARLNETIAQLERSLSMERDESDSLRLNLAQLSASLQTANMTRDELESRVEELETLLSEAQVQASDTTAQRNTVTTLQGQLASEREKSRAARDEVALLNQQLAALRTQLAQLQATLRASEERDKEQEAVIADLGRRLNVALAQRVQELASFRSEFFGRLRQAIGDQPGVRIVGDRFVVQSEVLFDSGSATLNEAGKIDLLTLVNSLKDIIQRIPDDIPWVLRVDGHTDQVPISTPVFPSNWELSTARATAVTRFLISQGIPPDHLAPTGFGEFQPIDARATPEAYRRNRRIEFKLTQR